MKKFALLLMIFAVIGCGSDTSVSLPENATAEPPEESASTGGGEAGDKKDPPAQTLPQRDRR